MSKHTTRLWVALESPNHGDLPGNMIHVVSYQDKNNWTSIAEVYGEYDKKKRKHSWQNAKLMAAAPDLLKACKLAIALMEKNMNQTWEMKPIYEAIAKAEDDSE